MPKLQCTYDEALSAATKKINQGEHTHEWQFESFVDGKFQGKVTIPHGRGSDQIPIGTLKSILRQLRLTREQFADWRDCPMSREEYEDILRGQFVP